MVCTVLIGTSTIEVCSAILCQFLHPCRTLSAAGTRRADRRHRCHARRLRLGARRNSQITNSEENPPQIAPQRLTEGITASSAPAIQNHGYPLPYFLLYPVWSGPSTKMPLAPGCVHKRFATTVNAVPGSVSIKTDSEWSMIVAAKWKPTSNVRSAVHVLETL